MKTTRKWFKLWGIIVFKHKSYVKVQIVSVKIFKHMSYKWVQIVNVILFKHGCYIENFFDFFWKWDIVEK
jgi:hypothetical protein